MRMLADYEKLADQLEGGERMPRTFCLGHGEPVYGLVLYPGELTDTSKGWNLQRLVDKGIAVECELVGQTLPSDSLELDACPIGSRFPFKNANVIGWWESPFDVDTGEAISHLSTDELRARGWNVPTWVTIHRQVVSLLAGKGRTYVEMPALRTDGTVVSVNVYAARNASSKMYIGDRAELLTAEGLIKFIHGPAFASL